MKKIIMVLILFFLSVIQSCEEPPEQGIPINSSFIYPLNIGNQWTYAVSVDYSDIQPDSIKSRLTDYSFEYTDIVTRDTMINSIQLYEIKEESEDLPESYAYFANETNGFFRYAVRYIEDDPNLAKTAIIKSILHQRIGLNRFYEFNSLPGEAVAFAYALTDSVYFFENPDMLYLYPWKIGAQWNYSIVPVIRKKVIGKETIETDAGVYDCYEIQYLSNNPVYLEYVSVIGLMKVVVNYDNMLITSPEHPEGIGQADMKIVIELTDVNF